MTNFAKVSSLIFMDNMRCVADLIFGGVCHRFPDLKFVSVESGVGWMPGRDGDVRLAVAQRRRRATSTPSTTCCRASTSGARSTAASGSSEQTALDAIAQYPDNILFETDYPHPTCQHPGPRTPAQRPREYAERVLRRAARRRRRARCCTTTRPRSTGSHERASDLAAPDLGSRFLVTEVEDRVLHLRVNRARAAQRLHPGHVPRAQAGGDLGRPAARARRGLPHRHRQVVRRRRRHGRQRRGPRRPGQRSGTGTDHFPFRHIERCTQALGREDQRRCASPAASTWCCTATWPSRRTGPGSACPSCCAASPTRSCRPASSTSVGLARARYLFFTAAEIDAAGGSRHGPGRQGRPARRPRRRDRPDPRRPSPTPAPSPAPAIKRDLNRRLPRTTLT